MLNEPRPHSRIPDCANAVLIRLPRLYEVSLLDISLHGVLLRPNANVEIGAGDHTRLRVLTAKGNQAFELEARVAYYSERLIGLEISAIDHHAKRTLHRMIEMNPGTPDLATRSLPDLLREYFSLSPSYSAGRVHARKGAGAPQRIHA